MLFETLIFLACLILGVTLFRNGELRRELNVYIEEDFSKQEGWSHKKTEALKKGAVNGHDLKRLSDSLHQSEASVRAKLVGMKIYDQYLETQVDNSEAKLKELEKLKIKIGRVDRPKAEQLSDDKSALPLPPSWKLIQSLSENWFDPSLEFCQTFYNSPLNNAEDPRVQHEVIKHVAAFLNTAGGRVLIGFGMKGKLLGLLDDDLRTQHHYQYRLEQTLGKCLGNSSTHYLKVHMIRWGSEDVCLINCEKADSEVVCIHQKFNEVMGLDHREKLVYRRIKAQTQYDALHQQTGPQET